MVDFSEKDKQYLNKLKETNTGWQEIIEFKLTESLSSNSKGISPLRTFSATFFKLVEYFRVNSVNENSVNATDELWLSYANALPTLQKLFQAKVEEFLAHANATATLKLEKAILSALAEIITNYYFLNLTVIQALLPYVTYSTVQEKDLQDPSKSTSRAIQEIDKQNAAVQNVITQVMNGEQEIIAKFDTIKDITWVKPMIMDLQAALYPTPDRSQLGKGILPCFNQKLKIIRNENTNSSMTTSGRDEANVETTLPDLTASPFWFVELALREYMSYERGNKEFAQIQLKRLQEPKGFENHGYHVIKEITQRPHKTDYTAESLTVIVLKHLLNSPFKNDFFEATANDLQIANPFSNKQFIQEILGNLKAEYMPKNKNPFSTFTKRFSQISSSPSNTGRFRSFSTVSMKSSKKPPLPEITTSTTSAASTSSAAPQPQSSEAENWIMALTICTELAFDANAENSAEMTFQTNINTINQKLEEVNLKNMSEKDLLNNVSIFKFDLIMALKNLFKTEGVKSSALAGKLLNRLCDDQSLSQLFFKPSVSEAMTNNFSQQEDKTAALLAHLQPSYKDVNAQFKLKAQAIAAIIS